MGQEEPCRQIVARRRQLGLTQAQLAHKAGIPQQHLSLIETGKVQPTLGIWLRILEAAGMEVLFRPAPGLFGDLDLRLQAFRRFNAWERLERPPFSLDEAFARAGEMAALQSSQAGPSVPEDWAAQALAWKKWRSLLPQRLP